MIFGKQTASNRVARIVSNNVDSATGKPGHIDHPNVHSFEVKGEQLCGHDSKGATVLVVPIASVALAVIEEKT